MKKIERVVSNSVFFILCLLSILLIFENYVSIPIWLWPIGRMHPLLLHFPIALIVLLAVLKIFQRQLEPNSFDKVQKFLLYLTAITTSVTALMGFFLSKEPGNNSDLMLLHKWIGVTVGFLVYGLMLTYKKKLAYNSLLSVSVVGIVFAGHLGAGLTHGVNFLIEPILKSKVDEVTVNSPIYSGFIAPIFEQKCQGCHNAQKHKGGLDMSNVHNLYEGGENGPIWESGNAEESELILRTALPIDHEDHMPPEGKAQLTQDEFKMIYQWIASGADTISAVADLEESDTLFKLATSMLVKWNGPHDGNRYDFDFAKEKVIESLNNPYRSVSQITPSSPAISVNIYVQQAYKTEFLTELKKIRNQIVFLNLANLPIEDADLSVIAQFKNLEKLNLNGTKITGKTLDILAACTNLKSLSLGSTNVDSDKIKAISKFDGLKELFIWNTGIDREEIQVLTVEYPKIEFHMGYRASDDPPQKLTSPILKNKNQVVDKYEKIALEHKLNGTSIRYTLDGSEPDSLVSMIYDQPFKIENTLSVKTKAFRANWLSSDTKTYGFFVKGIKADSAKLITKPSPEYEGRGAFSLIDHKKGIARDFKTGLWLGYSGKALEAIIDLGSNPKEIKEVVLCYGVNTRSYIMPPVKVNVYGGHRPNDLVFLGKATPEIPKEHQLSEEKTVSIAVAKGSYRYYKIEAEPIAKLPAWHEGAGEEGWVFVDEIFFY